MRTRMNDGRGEEQEVGRRRVGGAAAVGGRHAISASPGSLPLQRSAGNAAFLQILRQSGHPWAQEQHRHDAGSAVQRSVDGAGKRWRPTASRATPGMPPVQRANTKKRKTDTSSRGGFNEDTVPYALMRPVAKILVDEYGWESYGAHASLTLHLPIRKEGATPKQKLSHAAEKIYGGASNERPARVFDNKPLRAIRWIATTALRRHASGVEVQASLAEAGKLYISSNINSVNAQLKKLADEHKTVREFVGALLEMEVKADKAGSDREKRHERHARERLADPEVLSKDDPEYAAKKAADRWPELADLRGRTVDVPAAHEDDGHHAERRIDEHLAKQHPGEDRPMVKPDNTAGVKRPCVGCYLALYAKHHDITPTTVGAAWFSKNAWQGTVDEAKLADIGNLKALAKQIHIAVRAAGGTSITLCRDHKTPSGKPWDHGTDSESENEPEASGAHPTQELNMAGMGLGRSQEMEE
ncbi:hypothetical protein ACIRFH_28195 [Streptomyces sp. NPDC093586]|uniref:hypothetical protein n=1 Tax=Streptomyces sp. NPDC093586 TaxID=3366042 RepID=UPI0038241E2B